MSAEAVLIQAPPTVIVLEQTSNVVAMLSADQQGPMGPQGLSAYQVALANGFVGDEAAWLASLAAGTGGGSVLVFQITAASSYTATHAFAYRPRAWLVDASGIEVDTDVVYAASTVTVIFPAPFTGTLYLG